LLIHENSVFNPAFDSNSEVMTLMVGAITLHFGIGEAPEITARRTCALCF